MHGPFAMNASDSSASYLLSSLGGLGLGSGLLDGSLCGSLGGLLGSLFSLLGGFLGGIDDRRGRRSGSRLFLLGTGGETNGNQGGEKQGTGIHRKISSRKVKTVFLADRKRP